MTAKTTSKFRTESDLLGSKEVPEEALYGVQTTRAIENFHGQLPQFHKRYGHHEESRSTCQL